MENTGRNDWLTSQSLERSLDVISAINRLSIHSKLHLAQLKDTNSPEEIASARDALMIFVGTLSDLVERAGQSEDRIAFGADPRISSLARKFLADSFQGAGAVLYRPEELKELRALLAAGDEVDHQALIDDLARLRAVVEQHAQADAAIVFNEV